MGKPKQKKANYNEDIIIALIEKYGFKRDYILKSIRGDRVGMIPIRIQEDYNKLNAAAKSIVNKKIADV